MANKGFTLTVLSLILLSIYLFINAPVPLQNHVKKDNLIPVEQALEILKQENDIARAIYTQYVVVNGSKKGIKFDEEWDDDQLNAGPLPAQFLRLTALSLEQNSMPIGLFLGSDFAINKSNLFEGEQLLTFQLLKKTRKTHFFFVQDAGRYAYMAPDIASAKGCVNCHNEHEESPKDNWKLNDVMGATTWTYPNEHVSYQELLGMLAALRKGFRDAYNNVLDEIRLMQPLPKIGHQWPNDGLFMPDADAFMKRVNAYSAVSTMDKLMVLQDLLLKGE